MTHAAPTPLNLVYWPMAQGSGNFGDELSKVITEHLVDSDRYAVRHNAPGTGPDLMCIGSYLHKAPEGAHVFGSALLTLQCPQFRRLRVAAVRGPLTRHHLLEVNPHLVVPEVYGDPALLLPRRYSPRRIVELADKVAVVPHWSNYDRYKSRGLPAGYHLVCPFWHWERVIDEMTSCRVVISSSLHGLVCADAYGLPNVWLDEYVLLRAGGHEEQKDAHFKFHDYFESQGRPFSNISSIVEASFDDGVFYTGGNRIDLEALERAFPFP